MWMVAGVNKRLDGPLATYNVLTDPNLVHYFNNSSVRRHLVGMGLIRKDGSIIPEGVYRRRYEAQEHKKLSHETLASAIVKKTIDLERMRQVEIQRHLEELAKIELVERVRSARARMKRNKSAPPELSKLRPKSGRPHRVRLLRSAPPPQNRSPDSPAQRRRWDTSSFQLDYGLRPYSATNNGYADNGDDDDSKHESESSKGDADQPAEGAGERDEEEDEDNSSSVFSNRSADRLPFSISREHRPKSAHPRRREKRKASNISLAAIQQHYAERTRELLRSTVSPYLWPLFSDMTALKNARKISPKKRKTKPRAQSAMTTRVKQDGGQALTIRDLLDWNNDESLEKLLLKSTKKPGKKNKYRPKDREKRQCNITLRYVGNPVIQKIAPSGRKHEIVIFQQHCGGTCIPVYRGVVVVGEIFTFASRRHYGYPFSVNIFVDGIRDLRLSACCEYRHQLGAKLGGLQGHFMLVNVDGNSPCIRCQVDKQLGDERPRHPKPVRYPLNRTASLKEAVDEPVLLKQMRTVRSSPSVKAIPPVRSTTPDVIKRLPIPQSRDGDGVKSSEESILTDEDVCEDRQSQEDSEEDDSIEDEGSFEEDEESEDSVVEDVLKEGGTKTEKTIARASSPCHDVEDVVPGDETNSLNRDYQTDSTGEDEVFVEETQTNVPLLKNIKKTENLSKKEIDKQHDKRNRLPMTHLSPRNTGNSNFSSDDDETNRQPVEHAQIVTADVHANPASTASSRQGSAKSALFRK